MKIKDQVSNRIRDMLTKDKFGVDDGFMAAFRSDVTNMVKDYFQVSGGVDVAVLENEDGKYGVKISFVADKINSFETTFSKRY